MAQAIRMALHYAEENLGVTDIFGEDVGPPLGGVFTATQGLKTAWNSPLDERGIDVRLGGGSRTVHGALLAGGLSWRLSASRVSRPRTVAIRPR